MSQLHAIVIEDDPKLSTIYVTALQHAGYDVALDINGDKYKMLLAEAEPALVILDLRLPYASGVDILLYIREKCPKTVIAVVTADLVQARNLPDKADYVLIKPVSMASLLKIAASVSAAVSQKPSS